MSGHHHIEGGTILGTVSGTGLTVLANIDSPDIAKTVVLAALGAVVSFCVSVGLNWTVKKIRRMINGDARKGK